MKIKTFFRKKNSGNVTNMYPLQNLPNVIIYRKFEKYVI